MSKVAFVLSLSELMGKSSVTSDFFSTLKVVLSSEFMSQTIGDGPLDGDEPSSDGS